MFVPIVLGQAGTVAQNKIGFGFLHLKIGLLMYPAPQYKPLNRIVKVARVLMGIEEEC